MLWHGGCGSCPEELQFSAEFTVQSNDGNGLRNLRAEFRVAGGSWRPCSIGIDGSATGSDAWVTCGEEQGGTIDIEVSAAGYESHRFTVEVEQDRCGILTATPPTVILEPTGSGDGRSG